VPRAVLPDLSAKIAVAVRRQKDAEKSGPRVSHSYRESTTRYLPVNVLALSRQRANQNHRDRRVAEVLVADLLSNRFRREVRVDVTLPCTAPGMIAPNRLPNLTSKMVFRDSSQFVVVAHEDLVETRSLDTYLIAWGDGRLASGCS